MIALRVSHHQSHNMAIIYHNYYDSPESLPPPEAFENTENLPPLTRISVTPKVSHHQSYHYENTDTSILAPPTPSNLPPLPIPPATVIVSLPAEA